MSWSAISAGSPAGSDSAIPFLLSAVLSRDYGNSLPIHFPTPSVLRPATDLPLRPELCERLLGIHSPSEHKTHPRRRRIRWRSHQKPRCVDQQCRAPGFFGTGFFGTDPRRRIRAKGVTGTAFVSPQRQVQFCSRIFITACFAGFVLARRRTLSRWEAAL
jgi:hypothetical protein